MFTIKFTDGENAPKTFSTKEEFVEFVEQVAMWNFGHKNLTSMEASFNYRTDDYNHVWVHADDKRLAAEKAIEHGKDMGYYLLTIYNWEYDKKVKCSRWIKEDTL